MAADPKLLSATGSLETRNEKNPKKWKTTKNKMKNRKEADKKKETQIVSLKKWSKQLLRRYIAPFIFTAHIPFLKIEGACILVAWLIRKATEECTNSQHSEALLFLARPRQNR